MIFSKREFERRYERARELMREKRVDALFITGEENYHYFTGGAECPSIAPSPDPM